MTAPQLGKINFAGMVGAKRRRMRSGGNVSTLPGPSANNNNTNNNTNSSSSNNNNNDDPAKSDDPDMSLDSDDEKTTQTSKCKGATTIPIFLKKTYKMIDSCDSNIASWTPEGDMFVVKDPDMFATQVIPQYFDHNKFSSFARQLNFYGFRKMQSKPIRNSDFDEGTAKHVTFYNENFKRGRCDLLKKIQRSTRGGGNSPAQDQTREVLTLQDKVSELESTITQLSSQMEDRMRRLELDMLGRMEQMMLAMQQQQSMQFQSQSTSTSATPSNVPSSGPNASNSGKPSAINPRNHSILGQNNLNQNNNAQTTGILGWDPLPMGARGTSIGSISQALGGFAAPAPVQMPKNGSSDLGPTLPPHPKQKLLPPINFPGVGLPAERFNSLRGISNLSRGLSGLSRGASIESQGSVILRNQWEDKFFSMLMLGENGQPQVPHGGQQNGMDQMHPTPMADHVVGLINRGYSLSRPVVSNGSSIDDAGLEGSV